LTTHVLVGRRARRLNIALLGVEVDGFRDLVRAADAVSRGSSSPRSVVIMVTVDEIRAVALALPRTTEGFVRGQVKFYIGRIVYLAISRDESTLGFAFPKEWRAALVESEPEKFSLPSHSDMRYHWVHVDLAAIDADEMRALVEDAWAFVVPKRVAEEYAAARRYR
jgi:hypothetical protein